MKDKEKIFKPDYSQECETCGASPTVIVIDFDNSGLCGPCYFGAAKALDEDEWESL